MVAASTAFGVQRFVFYVESAGPEVLKMLKVGPILLNMLKLEPVLLRMLEVGPVLLEIPPDITALVDWA